MARDPVVQELLDKFVVSNQTTGKRRAVAILYRTLANSLGRDLQDSGELVEALTLLLMSREIAFVGALNPRPVPDTATPRTRGVAAAIPVPAVSGKEQSSGQG